MSVSVTGNPDMQAGGRVRALTRVLTNHVPPPSIQMVHLSRLALADGRGERIPLNRLTNRPHTCQIDDGAEPIDPLQPSLSDLTGKILGD